MDDLEEIRRKKLAELTAYAAQSAFRKTAKPVLLTDATFEDEARAAGLLLVDLWADWCAPCHMIAPAVEEITRDYAGWVRVGKLNIDENPMTPSRFGVQSIPTLLLFKDGKLVEGIVGVVPKARIARAIEKWL